jgi:hypothetical protein
MSERVPLTLLPNELRRLNVVERALPYSETYNAVVNDHTAGDNVEEEPTYREAYNAAVDGRIPAERGDNGRWSVARADLPLIRAALRRTRRRLPARAIAA